MPGNESFITLDNMFQNYAFYLKIWVWPS